MSPILPRRLLQTQTDARLVELCRAGHERAFEALVRRYRKPLLRYCQRMLLPDARAEDAIQQALLSAWSALQRGDEVADAQAWLYRIVHNTAVSALRKSGYDYETLSESLRGTDAPDEDLERRIAVREVLAGVAALPHLQREVLLRTAVKGQSHEEVAHALGLSDGAVRGMVYRARETLRAAATALTPPPLAAWAACAGVRGVPLAQRTGEVAVPGSAGVAGALMKGGAVALTAGSLVTGAVLVHHHRAGPGERSSASRTHLPGSSGREASNGAGVGAQDQNAAASPGGAAASGRSSFRVGLRRPGQHPRSGLLGRRTTETGRGGRGGGGAHGENALPMDQRTPSSGSADGGRHGGQHGGGGGGHGDHGGPGSGSGGGGSGGAQESGSGSGGGGSGGQGGASGGSDGGSGGGGSRDGGSGGSGSSDSGSGSGGGSSSSGGPAPSGVSNLVEGSGGGGGGSSDGGGSGSTTSGSGSDGASGASGPH